MKNTIFTLLVLTSSYSVYADSCPEKTPREWAEYFINRSSSLESNLRTFEGLWTDCEPYFTLNQDVKACAERILKKARHSRFNGGSGHSMGWEISDGEYTNSAPAGYLDLPPELEDGLPSNYREIARQKGWKVVDYRSRTVGNPPNGSYSRTLIMIPGEKVDKWIQFTQPERSGVSERLVDFIAMEKATGPNDKPTPYFTQFWRDSNGRNPERRTRFDNCYSCHPGGMRELSPEPGSYSAEDTPVLKEMKETMRGYILGRGGVDWGNALHPEDYGPPMGERQGCVKCHNNGEGNHEYSRGAITLRHDRGHVGHKMREDMTMPISMLPMEQNFFDFIEDVPTKLNPSELAELQSIMKNTSQGRMYNSLIDFMKDKNKISREEANTYKFILNGNPSYPNCSDQPDCYKGLNRFNDYYNQMYADYGDQMKEWLVEPCQSILDAGENTSRIAEPSQRRRDDNNSGYNEGYEEGASGSER